MVASRSAAAEHGATSKLSLGTGLISTKEVLQELRQLIAADQQSTAMKILDELIDSDASEQPFLQEGAWISICRPVLMRMPSNAQLEVVAAAAATKGDGKPAFSQVRNFSSTCLYSSYEVPTEPAVGQDVLAYARERPTRWQEQFCGALPAEEEAEIDAVSSDERFLAGVVHAEENWSSRGADEGKSDGGFSKSEASTPSIGKQNSRRQMFKAQVGRYTERVWEMASETASAMEAARQQTTYTCRDFRRELRTKTVSAHSRHY
eukprot:TRINITY_DN1738_c0_g2_i2.p1 TRINITY_DN1738_c0_g2~~TRINITY_DN1738_c0_g2_i2.p1  ORF type:complete len:286 (+),score=53.44 TRINITY_DN1738_c0_g2_i2:72-860(+)